jgi:hypothetical protein
MSTELPKITTFSEGSTDTISIDGFFIFRYIPTPATASLPPKPTADTFNISTLPTVSFHIVLISPENANGVK